MRHCCATISDTVRLLQCFMHSVVAPSVVVCRHDPLWFMHPAAIGKEKREAGKFAYHTLKAHYTQQAQLAAQQGVQGGTTCCEHTEQGQQQQQRKRKLQDVAEEDAEVKRALQLRVEAQKLLMTQHLGIVSAKCLLAC